MTEKQLEKKMLYLIDDRFKSPMYRDLSKPGIYDEPQLIIELTKECVELAKEYHNINKRNCIIDEIVGSKT